MFAARAHVNALRPGAQRGSTRAFVREIAPGEQVPARLELRGPAGREADWTSAATAPWWPGRGG